MNKNKSYLFICIMFLNLKKSSRFLPLLLVFLFTSCMSNPKKVDVLATEKIFSGYSRLLIQNDWPFPGEITLVEVGKDSDLSSIEEFSKLKQFPYRMGITQVEAYLKPSEQAFFEIPSGTYMIIIEAQFSKDRPKDRRIWRKEVEFEAGNKYEWSLYDSLH